MSAEHPEDLLHTIRNLPENPGIYQYFDKNGTIIYIGKSKNLKKRVGSYFTRDHQLDRKTRVLVANIRSIRYMVVKTELDALLLENNLIKAHQPRYNVNLKDDKTYPWIIIPKEPFPRVFATRKKKSGDGATYIGPFASVSAMYTMLDLIKQMYKIRNCKYLLSQANIRANKFRVCIEYHVGNCLGPCQGLQSEEDYTKQVNEIRQIVKGHVSPVIRALQDEMKSYASSLEFEKAEKAKLKMELLESYQAKSVVVNPGLDSFDAINLLHDNDDVFVNFLRVAEGAVVAGQTWEIKRKLDEAPLDLLQMGIAQAATYFGFPEKELVVPFELEIEGAAFLITVPQRGDKKKVLELSLDNARAYQTERNKQRALVDPDRHMRRMLLQMKKDLRLPNEPAYIECIDNSNLQGTNPVSALTVMRNLKPSKREYRHYLVRTVEGPDDFATMKEIITRRYGKMKESGVTLPNLLVVDGGKGQLSAAVEALDELGLRGTMAVIGIAKRLEEIYYPGDTLPLYLDKKSESLKVIQRIRDEAHRFGITHHRKVRQKNTIKTGLTSIDGIGESTAQILLRHFKSVKKIREASIQELEELIGSSRAKMVFDHYHTEPSA